MTEYLESSQSECHLRCTIPKETISFNIFFHIQYNCSMIFESKQLMSWMWIDVSISFWKHALSMYLMDMSTCSWFQNDLKGLESYGKIIIQRVSSILREHHLANMKVLVVFAALMAMASSNPGKREFAFPSLDMWYFFHDFRNGEYFEIWKARPSKTIKVWFGTSCYIIFCW